MEMNRKNIYKLRTKKNKQRSQKNQEQNMNEIKNKGEERKKINKVGNYFE